MNQRRPFRSETFRANFHLSTAAIIDYIREYGLNISADSYEFQAELREFYNCHAPKSAVALAALLTGHVLIPGKGGSFTFDHAGELT